MSYDAWGSSWGSAWGVSWVHGQTVVVVYTHDGERKKLDEYRLAKEALKTQITEAFEIVTGETRIPEPVEITRFEKKAGQLPKLERPAYRKTFLQIRNWQQEIERIDRIMNDLEQQRLLAQDDEDIEAILRFL